MSKIALAIANAIYDFKTGVIETHDQLYEQLHKDLDFVKVKVWREDDSIPLPTYGKEGDACCDVYAKNIEYDQDKDRYVIHTGLHFALPEDYEMVIRPRSSNTKTELYMPNSPGTLDWGYRGELLIIYKNRVADDVLCILNYFGFVLGETYPSLNGNEEAYNAILEARRLYDNMPAKKGFPYVVGDRICQILVKHRPLIEWDEVKTADELGTTDRGTGGFGSTGGSKINETNDKR